jgi:hypothetical protein
MVMEIIYAILGPRFLIERINEIALILGAVLLVILSDFFNGNIIFPIADSVRIKTHKKMSKTKTHEKVPWLSKYLSEGLATLVFISYCYLGASVVAEYIFAPIMFKLKNFILPIVIILFVLISVLINDKVARKKLMKV